MADDSANFRTPTFDDPSRLVELNLASMWPNLRAAGARCPVVAGIIVNREQRDRFQAAIPGGELTLCRLRAEPETLTARILRRGQIEGEGTGGAVSALTFQELKEYGEGAADFAARLDANSGHRTWLVGMSPKMGADTTVRGGSPAEGPLGTRAVAA